MDLTTARAVQAGVKEDHLTLVAAGVAFFAFLALVPSLVAVVSVVGLIADPERVESQVEDLLGALPEEARSIITEQLQAITSSSGGALGIGLAVSLGAALWASSAGMAHLIAAVNLLHGGSTEPRSFVRRRAMALAFTLGAVVFALLAIAAIAVWPAVVNAIVPGPTARWLLRLAVWPALAVALNLALAVLYHYAPNRSDLGWRRVTWGSAIAVGLWIVVSVGFQYYAANFGSYNSTYGSLAAVVVLLIWFWISLIAILLGAKIDATTRADRPAA